MIAMMVIGQFSVQFLVSCDLCGQSLYRFLVHYSMC